METLAIKLSKAQRAFVETQVAEGGFRSVNAYLDALLRAERRRKAEEKLLQMVLEAEESGPATPMTREDWNQLKRRVWERHGQKENDRAQGGRRAESSERRAGGAIGSPLSALRPPLLLVQEQLIPGRSQ